MNYQEAIEYIHATYKFGEKIELTNITALLEELGNPQDKLKFVHVAGTNGKGSTCAMLSSVLISAGYKTGFYISPYLEEFNERIQINRIPVPNDDLVENTLEIKQAIDRMLAKGHKHPSEFEVITAIGFNYFAKENVDIVVLEVGMGGRFDATNVIKDKEAAVIVSLSFDHQAYLGNTLEEIAFEKAGIIKENTDVSVYALNPQSTHDVMIKKANEVGARVHICNPDDIELISTSIDGQKVLYKKSDSILGVTEFTLSLLGKHQLYNALNALNTLEILKGKGWNITAEAILEGLSSVAFTGRFEILNRDPIILIDGGHNIDGITSFTNNIKMYFADKKVVLFYGMLRDKQVKDSLDLLTSVAKKIYTLTPEDERAVPAKEMEEFITKNYTGVEAIAIEDFCDIPNYLDLSDKDEIFAFTGSLYMIGAARTIINNFLRENK